MPPKNNARHCGWRATRWAYGRWSSGFLDEYRSRGFDVTLVSHIITFPGLLVFVCNILTITTSMTIITIIFIIS